MIQSVHYDMEDLLEQANEIQETLGRSYAVPDEIDEADLQAGEYTAQADAYDGLTLMSIVELDALELDVEEEGPSYLSDLNKVPDFVDEAPIELSEVSPCRCPRKPFVLTAPLDSRAEGSGQDIGIDNQWTVCISPHIISV